MRRGLLFILLASLAVTPAFGQESPESAAQTTDGKVHLKPLEITEAKDTTQRITQEDLQRVNATNLWEAMSLAPGVNLGLSGARNDSRLTIRGFRQDQIRVLMDGVPTYIPYDGNEDFARYLISDLESIEVSKGYSSVLTGTGALGGTINLISARPKKEFEFQARYVNYFDNRFDDMARQVSGSMGTKQDLYFLKVSGAFVEQDFFRVSEDFNGSPLTSYNNGRDQIQNQPSGKRRHSGYRDSKINIQAGLTPTADSELVFGYIRQRSEKDQPPYDGNDRPNTNNPARRHWQWPTWDKDSYNLSTKFEPVDSLTVKANAYYEQYENVLTDYRYDWTYTYPDNKSKYQDHAYGGRLELDYEFNDMHSVALSGSYRRDAHRRKDRQILRGAEDWHATKNVKDDLWIGALEYTLKPVERLTLVFGVSYTSLEPEKVWEDTDRWGLELGTGKNREAWDGQGGLFFDITENHQVYGTIAKKTRMPSMRERYRLTASGGGNDPIDYSRLPNPNLRPEEAMHYEIGYRGTIQNKIKLGASLFHSEVKDLIADATTTSPYTGENVSQHQNVNKASFRGIEVTLDTVVNEYLSLGATYSYLEWKIRDRGDISDDTTFKLTDLPRVKANAYAVITPIEGLSLIPRMEYRSESYYTSNSKNTNKEFALAHFKAMYDITENFTLEAGVDNVFDAHYEYEEGYSMPGRTYYTGLSVKF